MAAVGSGKMTWRQHCDNENWHLTLTEASINAFAVAIPIAESPDTLRQDGEHVYKILTHADIATADCPTLLEMQQSLDIEKQYAEERFPPEGFINLQIKGDCNLNYSLCYWREHNKTRWYPLSAVTAHEEYHSKLLGFFWNSRLPELNQDLANNPVPFSVTNNKDEARKLAFNSDLREKLRGWQQEERFVLDCSRDHVLVDSDISTAPADQCASLTGHSVSFAEIEKQEMERLEALIEVRREQLDDCPNVFTPYDGIVFEAVKESPGL